jgi:hypothetical protein
MATRYVVTYQLHSHLKVNLKQQQIGY